MNIIERIEKKESSICVIGLGFVGLPLAVEFANNGFKVTGYDVDKWKIGELSKGNDVVNELDKDEFRKIVSDGKISFTTNPDVISSSDVNIICVPTLLTEDKEPDLSHIKTAASMVGGKMKKGSMVVLESSVYPGTTENIVKSILEKESGMKVGDFLLAYSPERANPGDKEHTLLTVVKVVSGIDEISRNAAEKLYRKICKAGVFAAKNMRTAEAAKLTENIQRDVNIALMNELSIMFEKMEIDIEDVIKTSKTKWNFIEFHPGLVGGYCVPVNPYYMMYRAREVGYDPSFIKAAREMNESMKKRVAEKIISELKKKGKPPEGSNVLISGLTFKKNVKDTRSSPAKDIINILKSNGVNVFGHDPMLTEEEIEKEFGIKTSQPDKVDYVFVLVVHDCRV